LRRFYTAEISRLALERLLAKVDGAFWNWLKAWSDDHSGLIVLAALSLPMLFACLRIACAPKRWDRLEGYFNDPAFYPMLLERYKTGGGEAYFVILRRISLFEQMSGSPEVWSCIVT